MEQSDASFGIGLWELLIFLFVFVAAALPAYIVGVRRGVNDSWLAFIPFVGVWIVLLRSAGTSGWWTAIILVPYLGGLGLFLWLAFTIPKRHERSGWWTVAFIVVPVISYWVYALTLSDLRLTATA